MNKSAYLALSIKDLTKYFENAKLCYMDTSNFIIHVKTDELYKDIAENVETRFDMSNI